MGRLQGTPSSLTSTRPGPAGGCFLRTCWSGSSFRGRGIGKELLTRVAIIAVEENCYGVHWEVLDWNEKAIEFYKSLGAEFRDQWRPVLLADDALRRLAEKAG